MPSISQPVIIYFVITCLILTSIFYCLNLPLDEWFCDFCIPVESQDERCGGLVQEILEYSNTQFFEPEKIMRSMNFIFFSKVLIMYVLEAKLRILP